jgi:hypothetical protein
MSVQSKSIGKVTELTIINKIIPGKADQLRQTLAAIQVSPNSPIKKISTIHFARWVIIDNDTRLLFCSNFDGSWEQYLRDFATLAPEGLDAIWQYVEGYPKSQPFEPFANFVRQSQVSVDLFYAAYPDATVKSVLRALDVKTLVDKFVEQVG